MGKSKNYCFTLGLLNIRSLNTGWDELVQSIQLGNFDILCLTETWLKTDSNCSLYSIPGYKLVHSPRRGRGGGVGAYLKTGLRVKRLEQPDGELEQMWIAVKFERYNAVFGIVYRPESVSIGLAIDCLQNPLAQYLLEYDFLFLLGDLNINCISSDGNTFIPSCLRVLNESYNLHQVIDKATRITSTSSTLIDVIFTRTNLKPLMIEVSHNDDLSDHGLISAKFAIEHSKLKPRQVTFRPLGANADAINNAARFTPWDLVLAYTDINDMVGTFNSLVLDLMDTFAPVQTRTFRRPPTPWMTDTLKQMRAARDRTCHPLSYYYYV